MTGDPAAASPETPATLLTPRSRARYYRSLAFGGGEALLLEYDADGDGKINENFTKMCISCFDSAP